MKQKLWSTSVQTNAIAYYFMYKTKCCKSLGHLEQPADPQRKQQFAVCRLFDMRRIFQGDRDNRTNKAVNFMNDSIK